MTPKEQADKKAMEIVNDLWRKRSHSGNANPLLKTSREIISTHLESLYLAWESEWWKPSKDPIKNLVKAGALIAAEIDRLQHINNLHQQH